MLSRSSKFGPLVVVAVAVVMPWQTIISSKTLLLPSPLHPPTRSLFTPVSPILTISTNFWGPGGRQQQLGKPSRRGRVLVKSLLVNLVSGISTNLKDGAPSYYAQSALSSPLCRSSVILKRPGVGQQRQHRNRRSSSQRSQDYGMKILFVEAIASTEDPTANFNQNPSLDDELHRYGVHESDYRFQKIVEPQEPDFSQDMKNQRRTTSSTSMPRKRKTSVDLTSGSKEQQQQQPLSKEKSGVVVQDWCCYLLLSVDSKKTYVGVTFDIRRRLRQHNGEIAGGAKSARAGRPWRLICTVQGFNSRSEACQFEWRWKSTAAKIKTIKQQQSEIVESPLITRRRATLAKVLESKEDWNYIHVQWHAD